MFADLNLGAVKSRHLLIAAASGYDGRMLAPFVNSAAHFLRDCHILLFSTKSKEDLSSSFSAPAEMYSVIAPPGEALRRALQHLRRGRTRLSQLLLSVDKRLHPELLSTFGAALICPALARYFWSRAICRQFAQRFEMIAFSDTRDVIFQGDIFEEFSVTEIISGLEPVAIGVDRYTGSWIRDYYPLLAGELSGQPVICSGFTAGGSGPMLDYFEKMCRALSALSVAQLIGTFYDQAVHCKLLHLTPSLKGRLRLVENAEGLISTLSYQGRDSVRSDENARLIEVAGRHPRVVHQYDRYAELVGFVQRVWGATRQVNALAQAQCD